MRRAVVLLGSAWPCRRVPSRRPFRQDAGAAGAWQKILKARTTASVMHTTAHPDDEHGGVITRLSAQRRGAAGADDAQPRRIGRQRHRPAALRRARPDPHRGAARRRSLLRRGRAVLHHGGRLRLLEAARGGVRQVGQGQRDARRGAGHPHQPAVGAAVALPGQRARRPRQPPDRRPDHRAGVQAGRRSEHVSRADQGRAAAVAAVQGLHRRRARERGLDGAHRQRRVQPLSRRLLRQRRPLRPQLPALAEQRPLQPGRRRPQLRLLLAASARGWRRRRPRNRAIFDGLNTSYSGLFSTLGRRSPEGVADQLARVDGAFGRATADFTLHRSVGARRPAWPPRCSSSARPSPRAPARTRRCSCCASRSGRPRRRSPPASGWS